MSVIATAPTPTATKSVFIPSPYQQAIFDWITTGTGHLMVGATAGSGKTSTAVEAAINHIASRDIVMVAFGNEIARELERRLAGTGVTVKTTYSIGNGCLYKVLGKTEIDGRKYSKLCLDYVKTRQAVWLIDGVQIGKEGDESAVLLDMVNKARLTLTNPRDPQALEAMCNAYDIEPRAHLIASVARIIEIGETVARTQKVIDFTDMIYLPAAWDLMPRKFAWVICDEVQDLSGAQRALVLKMIGPGGRFIGIGDRSQAIFGFAGADQESFDNTKQALGATELPLSICYRCAADICAEAQRVLDKAQPGARIEARPGAPSGAVRHEKEAQLPKLIQEGDTILCRLTAPLISWAIRLIQMRIPARVLGRDIGKDLVSLLDTIAKLDGYAYERTNEYLDAYLQMMKVKYGKYDVVTGGFVISEENELKWETLNDKILAIRTCYQSFTDCKNVQRLGDEIAALFSDQRASVTLATAHRAKGKEFPRVYILLPNKMPLVWKGQTDAAYRQEMNLKFVAITRAEHELIWLQP